MSVISQSRKRKGRAAKLVVCDELESRQLMAAVTVDTTQVVRTIDPRFSGANLAWWQGEVNTTKMQQMASSAGLALFRMPGGSAVDANYHFNNAPPYNGYATTPIMANFIQAAGGDAIVTVNYGTGSPQEAAAMLAYLNAPVTSTVSIGVGQQWDPTSNTWVQKDWQTAGYWASLRAATPLATDDGLNFLRVNHPTPWGFSDYEVGNEEYATWEMDEHSATGVGGSSPSTYIGFAKTFSTLAAQIDAHVKIGIDVSPPLRYNMPDPNWTSDLLTQSAAQGFVPGFLSDHAYITGLSDQDLLLYSVNDPSFKQDNYNGSWAGRASYYRTLLNQDLGASAPGVQLMLTEFNSDINTKQSDNLIGGLWTADALGGLAQTEYVAAVQWDLTNGYNALSSPDTSHYGWRQGSDDGIIGTGSGNTPSTGAYVPYPAYFAQQLFSKLDLSGGSVLPVASDDPNLSVYAVKETNGHIRLLVINKSSTGTISGAFAFNGFSPTTTATQWQYGIAEDTAQSQTTDGHASLTTSTVTSASATGFTQSFPAYSMSVLDLTPTPVVRPKISIGDASITEGNSGTKTIAFPISLDKSWSSAINILFNTIDGTATAGSDYVASSGTLTIAAGQTSAVLLVTVNGDTTVEPNETFSVVISSNDADLARSQATGTILNDDVAPVATASLSGTAFNDNNANAKFDSGDTAGKSVVVFLDLNGNNVLDAGDVSTKTDSNGNFTFGKLAAGTYHVREVLDATHTYSTPLIDLTLTTGQVKTGLLIGSKTIKSPPPPPTGSLSGDAFIDNNANGIYDKADSVGKNVIVFLDTNNNGKLDAGETSVSTGTSGKFTFANLKAGTYHVRQVLPTGFVYSTKMIDLTLTAGQATKGLLLGEKKKK